MKKLIFTLLLALLSTVGAMAQSKIYDKVRNDSDFETVYVGKAMLQMAKGTSMNINGMDLNSMMDRLESIAVINTDKSAGCKKLKELVAKELTPKKGYDIMMETKEDDESTVIYNRAINKETNEYVLVSIESDEVSVIIITGSITPSELKNMSL